MTITKKQLIEYNHKLEHAEHAAMDAKIDLVKTVNEFAALIGVPKLKPTVTYAEAMDQVQRMKRFCLSDIGRLTIEEGEIEHDQ